MNIGDLNRRVTVWHNVKTLNTETYVTEPTETAIKTVWASIQPKTGSLLSGREAGTMLSQTTHLIKVRCSSVSSFLSPDCWFIYKDPQGNTHRYDIDYIQDPYMDHSFFDVYVREVV